MASISSLFTSAWNYLTASSAQSAATSQAVPQPPFRPVHTFSQLLDIAVRYDFRELDALPRDLKLFYDSNRKIVHIGYDRFTLQDLASSFGCLAHLIGGMNRTVFDGYSQGLSHGLFLTKG